MSLSSHSYLITYDLHKPDRTYTRLYQLLAAWGAVRLANSIWLVLLPGPAPIIRDIVKRTLEIQDTVAVVQLGIGADWATSRASPAASAWLSAYVMPAQEAA